MRSGAIARWSSNVEIVVCGHCDRVLCVVSLCSIHTGASDEYKLIETTHGVIRGKVATTLFKQRKYYSFRGIPYARSPVGPLRFKVIIAVRRIIAYVWNALKMRLYCRRLNRLNRGRVCSMLWTMGPNVYRKAHTTWAITSCMAAKTVCSWMFLCQVKIL